VTCDAHDKSAISNKYARTTVDQRVDIIDCQYQLWQLIEIVIGIGAWQIIAIIDCCFF